MGLTSSHDFCPLGEDLQVETALEEVADLIKDRTDWDMRRCRVLQNHVELVEVWMLERDIIPVLLEGLLWHLLDVFNHLVHEDRQLDFKAGLLGLGGVTLDRD